MFRSKTSLLTTAIAISLGLPLSTYGQSKPTQKDEQDIETLVITSNPLNPTVLESATPVSIITGEDLESRIAPTLGETLKNVPGVHSNYFGPIASSPIIRGLEGPRVKILQNGLDTSDASRVGPDHIVTTEAANATQIEVLRGPATLLYGAGAIGGVVNVVDNRLPTQKVDGVEGKASYLHDTVSSEDLFNVSLDGGSGELLWHFDAFDRSTEDYEIPGPAEVGGEDEGVLENSFIDADGFNVGLGWATDNFNTAFSFGQLESEYGIPGHAHEEEHDDEHEDEDHDDDDHEDEAHDEHDEHDEHEEEVIFGRLQQDRFQALFDWTNLSGFISEVRFKTAYTDYEHSEIEDGEVGTTFENETFESRLWAKHASQSGWDGVIGVDYISSDFSALGEEAFTPASDSQTIGLFILEEKRIDNLLWQFGARVERTNIEIDNAFFEHEEEEHEEEEMHEEEEHEEIEFDDVDFTALSLSAGAVWTLDKENTVSINVAHAQRAPSAAEMFSNGLHIATGTYEVGAGFEIEIEEDGEFEIIQGANQAQKEVSNNIDLTWHHTGEHIEATFSIFYNQIDDYLFQQNTGLFFEDDHGHDDEHEDEDHDDDHDEEGHEGEDHDDDAHDDEDGLAVFVFRQQDADIFGFEAEVDWHFNDNLRLETYADLTRAELSDGSNVPRIPPMRVGAELHWENDNLHAEIGATYYAKQDNIAEFETETDSYTLVNFAVNYYMDISDQDVVLFLRGNNLTDEEARVHASFIKDEAPLPGRSFVVGARVNF